MASITTWQRLEPRTRTETLSAVRARLYDPAWLLMRQRQLGEWHGEDAGSAVRAELTGRRSTLSRYRPRSGTAVAFPADAPLEAFVESETSRSAATTGPVFSARAGQHFLRSLGHELAGRYRAAYLARYALPAPAAPLLAGLDDASRRLLDVLVSKVPDGAALYQDLVATVRPAVGAPALPAQPAIAAGDAAAVLAAAEAWLAWVDSMRPPQRPETWDPEHLEYVFSVGAASPSAGAPAEVTLTAAGFADGHLDWHAFDVDDSVALGAAAPTQNWGATAIPTPVRFPGMPNARWWEFEDGAVNLGSIDAAPDDLGRLALLEFSLVYGNDFLHVPVELPIGALCWIDRLTVTNTFNESFDVDSVEEADGAAGTWSMFRISGPGSERGDFLFLAPTVDASLHGGDLEKILLMRDEMANVAWGIEELVQTAAGTTTMPHELAADRAVEAPVPIQADDPPLRYRLATGLPEYWHALLPVTIAKSQAGVNWDNVVFEVSEQHPIQGELLSRVSQNARRIAEGEVPRTGAVVTRGWQRTRWTDGAVHVWVGRRKRSGRGEGSSGLRYDVVELDGS